MKDLWIYGVKSENCFYHQTLIYWWSMDWFCWEKLRRKPWFPPSNWLGVQIFPWSHSGKYYKQILKIVTRIICDLNILIFDEASDFGQRLGCQQRMVTWVTCSTELWPVTSHHFCSKSPDICSGTWTHAAPKFVQCIIFSWRAQIRWWISVLRSDRSSLLMHVLFHIFICVDIFLDVRTYPWPWLQLYSRILPKNITI